MLASSSTGTADARKVPRPIILDLANGNAMPATVGHGAESEHAHVSSNSGSHDMSAATEEHTSTSSQSLVPILQRPQPCTTGSKEAADLNSSSTQPAPAPAQMQDLITLLLPSDPFPAAEWPSLPGASKGEQQDSTHAAGSHSLLSWKTVIAHNVVKDAAAAVGVQDSPSTASGASSAEPSQDSVSDGPADFAAASRAQALFMQMGGSPQARRMLRHLCCPIAQVCWRPSDLAPVTEGFSA